MKRSLYMLHGATAGCFILLLAGCGRTGLDSAKIEPASLKGYAPLPDVAAATEPVTEEKVALGRMLYYDPRLSRSQQVSCNTCHGLQSFGVDNQPTSTGHKGQKGARNSPTVYNAAMQFVQFWDGRAPDVEEQAKGPVLNPVEMAMPSEKAVVAVLTSMPEYVKAFKTAFPNDKDPVTYNNMGKAIGAFERRLVTPARWDKFLKGDETALTAEEKVGFNTFARSGCPTCHAGSLLGGNMYQRLGTAKEWPDPSDLGRLNVTKNQADKLMFKVPSLRNIEKTGPYFHDGKVTSLNEAIVKMADYQVGTKLSDAEVQSIATWMKSLTGDIPAGYITQPELPKSTSRTPKPTESE